MGLAIYYRTLEFRVDDGGLTVGSAFRKAFTPFSEIGTLKIRAISRGRALEVRTVHGRRVLFIQSAFLPEFDTLVRELERATRLDASS